MKELKHKELFNLLRQNFKMTPHDSQLLDIQSNTNLGTAVKRFCRCNLNSNSVDVKVWRFIQVDLTDKIT